MKKVLALVLVMMMAFCISAMAEETPVLCKLHRRRAARGGRARL